MNKKLHDDIDGNEIAAEEPLDAEELTDDELVIEVVSFAEHAHSAQANVMDDMKLWYRLWRFGENDTYGADYATKARVVIPEIYGNVQTITHNNMQAILDNTKSIITCIAVTNGGVEYEKGVTKFINEQLRASHYDMPFLSKCMAFNQDGIITGNTHIRPFYRYEKTRVSIPAILVDERDEYNFDKTEINHVYLYQNPDNPDIPFPSTEKKESLEIESTISQPDFIVIPNDDILIDPEATSIENARGLAWKRYLTKTQIEEGAKNLYYEQDRVDALPEPVGYSKSDPITAATDKADQKAPGSDEAVTGPLVEKKYEVLEYYTDFEWIFIADRKHIIRNSKSPYQKAGKPFIKGGYEFVNGSYWWMGAVEPQAGLIEELNKKRRQILDASARQVDPPLLGDISRVPAKLLTGNTKYRPGVIYPVMGDPSGAIQPMPTTALSSLTFADGESIKQEMRNVVGTTSTTRGINVGGRRTKGETEMELGQGMKGLSYSVSGFFANVLVQLAEWYIALNRQYMADEYKFRAPDTAGWEDQSINPKAFLYRYRVVFGLDPVADNQAVRRQQIVNLLNVLKDNPAINQVELLKMIFQIFELPESEKLLNNPMPVIVKFLAMLVQQMQMPLPQEVMQALAQTGIPPQAMQSLMPPAPGMPGQGGPPGPGGVPQQNLSQATRPTDITADISRQMTRTD